MNKNKKITLATVKSFIKKNKENLFINVKSRFSGMTDGLENHNNGFQKVEVAKEMDEFTLGIKGAWFVRESRDWFSAFEENKFSGIKISNSCGSFIIAVKS